MPYSPCSTRKATALRSPGATTRKWPPSLQLEKSPHRNKKSAQPEEKKKNQAEDLNISPKKTYRWVTDTCEDALIIREMQIKAMKYHFTPFRMATVKKITSVGEDAEKRRTAGRNINWCSPMENNMTFP